MDPRLLFSRWTWVCEEKRLLYVKAPTVGLLELEMPGCVGGSFGVSQNTGVEVTLYDTFDVSVSTTCLLGCSVYRTGSVGEVRGRGRNNIDDITVDKRKEIFRGLENNPLK